MTVRPRQGWCPTVGQELLLRAALAESDSCLNSWREWKGTLNSSEIDNGSERLLPLVYHNLNVHDVEDSTMERLKEAYLQTWCNNELLFSEVTPILSSFQAAGIETILLKGAALALHFYKDPGLRPMSDVDILVHPHKARLAMAQLREAGWRSVYETPEILLSYQHAIEFSDGNGHRLDLHWRVLWDGLLDITDDDFWKSAIPMEMNNVKTRILNPTDQLLHVCVHGAAWNDLPSLRWVADAAFILRNSDSELDWDRLIEQTNKRRLMLPVRDTLGYLQSFLGNPLPTSVVNRIKAMPATLLERTLYRLRVGPNRHLRKLTTLYYWFNVWRRSRVPLVHKFSAFWKYFKCFLHVRHTRKTYST